jgi:hypothetical protein
MANLQLFCSVQGTGSCPTGPNPENKVGDQDTGSPSRLVSSGLPMPGEQGNCAKQDLLGELPAEFFLQNILQLHQNR